MSCRLLIYWTTLALSFPIVTPLFFLYGLLGWIHDYLDVLFVRLESWAYRYPSDQAIAYIDRLKDESNWVDWSE